jgi:LacI family transcriptional regulator, repressor for deo operon, udp, cdd, tsx, nupC, and nupG
MKLMSTVRTIAKQTGVSIATVSRVLNNHPSVSDELRDKVMSAANSRRYMSHVGKRETTNVACVYTGDPSLGSPFDAALLEGVYEAMADSNLNLMILDLRRTRRNGETYSQMFQRLGVRGAVLRTTHGTRSICEKIVGQGFPAVVVGDRLAGNEASCVYCESRSASREAIEHLTSLGHRRIAISVNIIEDSDHQERLAGYRAALEDHGLEIDDKLVMRAPANRQGGSQLIRRIVTAVDRPTAVYITDPMAAVGAMYEAHKMGLGVPEDLSIIGFDDTELRHTSLPTMTAVCQDAAGLGREAFRVLSELIKDKRAPEHKPPAAWLEVHDSTGPVAVRQ